MDKRLKPLIRGAGVGNFFYPQFAEDAPEHGPHGGLFFNDQNRQIGKIKTFHRRPRLERRPVGGPSLSGMSRRRSLPCQLPVEPERNLKSLYIFLYSKKLSLLA